MLKCIATLTLWFVFTSLPAFAAEPETVPAIDPRADELLREMSTFLGDLPQFTFHAENSIDEILETGQKIQLSNGVDVAMRRPDRFWAAIQGDSLDLQLFYDGKSVTQFNEKENFHATMDAPATIDESLDYCKKEFDLKAPLSELLVSDIYARIAPNIKTGHYLGLHRVQGVASHHLAFTTRDVDWQIWIDAGDKPWPRKLVITSKQVTGAPQFTALISDWDTAKKLNDNKFKFVAPEGAHKCEFLPADN